DRVRATRERLYSAATGHVEDEYRIERPDGELRWIRESVVAVPVEQGVRLNGVVADITDRKRAEHAVGELRELHKRILESVVEGIHGVDLHGRIMFENHAATRMLGRSLTQLVGKGAHETMHHSRADGAA